MAAKYPMTPPAQVRNVINKITNVRNDIMRSSAAIHMYCQEGLQNTALRESQYMRAHFTSELQIVLDDLLVLLNTLKES